MGEDDDMEKKAVYLGRGLEWSENGLGVRLDRRRVRSLLRELGIENCRSISTPLCATMEKEINRSDRPEVSAELATKHRAAVARVVYLAQDRLDLGVAAVELAKTMAIPREGDDERLKRVARYLHGHPDFMQWYTVQEETSTVVYMSRNTSIKFRRDLAVGGSSHRRVESSCSTAHRTEFG